MTLQKLMEMSERRSDEIFECVTFLLDGQCMFMENIHCRFTGRW